jgi:hypothetical protein
MCNCWVHYTGGRGMEKQPNWCMQSRCVQLWQITCVEVLTGEVSISAFWKSDGSSLVNNLARGKTTFTWVPPSSSAAFDYCSLGSVSTLKKRIIVNFQKMNSFSNFEMIYFSIIYYNVVIWVVKLFRVQLMIIMMVFNMSTSYFHKISFHYFEDYLMMKLTLV